MEVNVPHSWTTRRSVAGTVFFSALTAEPSWAESLTPTNAARVKISRHPAMNLDVMREIMFVTPQDKNLLHREERGRERKFLGELKSLGFMRAIRTRPIQALFSRD
jgi:hypothetical protein